MSTKIEPKSNKRKTTEQYKKELALVNPNIKCCDEYVNAKTPILHNCLVCGNEWMATPSHILSGTGCPPCNYKRGGNKQRISHKQFMQNLEGRLNPYVKVVGQYVDAHTKIKCECLLCEKELWITPGNLYIGHGCVSCMNRKNNPTKTHNQFLNEFLKINQSITFLSEYIGARDKIDCQCNVCGYVWQGTPTNLLRGHGCPRCGILAGWDKHRPSQKDYEKKLSQLNPSIKARGKYLTVDTPIEHECTICGYVWLVSPRNVCNKQHGCPKCICSCGEQRILSFLLKNNIQYSQWQKFNNLLGVNKSPLSYDFYISNKNVLIEFQGEQHERPIEHFGGQKHFEIQQEHDKSKREYAKEHGYKLIEIWYYDFDRIEEILTKELNIESVETEIGA